MARKKALPSLVKAHALRMTATEVKNAGPQERKGPRGLSEKESATKKRILAGLARLHPMD